ncbi:MAG: hypothetical protein CW716_08570 [Candidatus Bathyarchaeum sp.]|nr:MAG: hypothetical protein CW716_08570 [Candidatus Bathyarchaeum sp.]
MVAVAFGFGNYIVKQFMFWSTYGHVSRVSMFALLCLSSLLIVTAWVTRKKSKYLSVVLVVTSIVLFANALFALTTPLRGRDFWVNNIFENIQDGITFMQLSFGSYVCLGLTQIFIGNTFFKNQKRVAWLFTISGVLFVVGIFPIYLFPSIELINQTLLMFYLFAQIVSALVFYN